MLNRVEIDRATFFSLAARGWQLLGGAVTVFLIAQFYTPELQGYYYTFASLLALQSFFELGLTLVIVNLASHEWAGLALASNQRIIGDARAKSRLISLGRMIAGMYAVAATAFIACVGLAGYWFLSAKDVGEIDWIVPWFTLVTLTGVLLWMLPLNSLLEGCHQVAVVNRFRLCQAMSASIGVWVAISAGWELWAPVVAMAARVAWDAVLIGLRFRHFFADFFRPPEGERISWKLEMWPLQWRLVIGGVIGYFAYSLMTPVLFAYHGPSIAGQMGITWAIITAIQSGALAWLQTRVPRFGVLIANRNFVELDRVFWRLVSVSLRMLALGAGGMIGGLLVLQHWFPLVAARFLPIGPTAVLLAGVIFYHLPHCQSMYLRAHKQEPLLPVGLATCTSIGLSVFLLGRYWGAWGAAVGYAASVGVVNLPGTHLLWLRCRKQWHTD